MEENTQVAQEQAPVQETPPAQEVPAQTPEGQGMVNQPVRVNLNELPSLTCGSCGAAMWSQAYVVKRVPLNQSPTGKEEHITIPVMVCVVCKQALHTFELMAQMQPQQVNQDPNAPTPPGQPQVVTQPAANPVPQENTPDPAFDTAAQGDVQAPQANPGSFNPQPVK